MTACASKPLPPPPQSPGRKPKPVPNTPEDPEKGSVPPVTEPGKSEHPKQGCKLTKHQLRTPASAIFRLWTPASIQSGQDSRKKSGMTVSIVDLETFKVAKKVENISNGISVMQ